MTEAQLILVDIVLSRWKVGQTWRVHGALTNAGIGLADKYSEETVKEINDILITRSSVIRDILLEEGYLRIVDSSTHLDILTDEGAIAKTRGGHRQYLEWKEIQDRKESRLNATKKYWLLYDIAKLIAGGIIALTVKGIVCQPPRTQNVKTVGQQPMQLQPPKAPTPHLPKPSGKKDSL